MKIHGRIENNRAYNSGLSKMAGNEKTDNIQQAGDSRAGKDSRLTNDVDKRPMKQNVSEVVDGLNSIMDMVNRRMEFAVHKETGRLMVNVVDKDTQKVIKTIPPEEFLDLAARIDEMVGLFLDKRA